MIHPFDLDLAALQHLNLEFEEDLSQEEAAQVGGAWRPFTSRAMGEEGGWGPQPIQIRPKPIQPPAATTMALGEEGGWTFPPEFVMRPAPKDAPKDLENPPDMTTMALGEEGGDFFF